jgi:hypothetical protein
MPDKLTDRTSLDATFELVPVFKRCAFWAGLIGEYGFRAVTYLMQNTPRAVRKRHIQEGVLPEHYYRQISEKLDLPYRIARFVTDSAVQLYIESKQVGKLLPFDTESIGYDRLEAICGWAYLYELKTTLWGNALLRAYVDKGDSPLHWQYDPASGDISNAGKQLFCKIPVFLQPDRCLSCGGKLYADDKLARIFNGKHFQEKYCEKCQESEQRKIKETIENSLAALTASRQELVSDAVKIQRDATEEARSAAIMYAYARLIRLQQHSYTPRYMRVRAYKKLNPDMTWLYELMEHGSYRMDNVPPIFNGNIEGKTLLTINQGQKL